MIVALQIWPFWLGGCALLTLVHLSPSLGAGGCPALLQVEVFDVDGGDLAGPGGGLVQHPPPCLFPQRDVTAGQQPLDPGGGSALVVRLCSVAPLGAAGRLRGGAGRRERPS